MNTKKIYIKQIETVGKHDVWLVDGEFIRKEMDENFVAYDEHYHLPFIPKNEFWIDKDTNPSEWYFFVDHLINEKWCIEGGLTYEKASKRADILEKKERAKMLYIENPNKNKESAHHTIELIHRKLLYNCSDILNVWLVDGKVVRDNLFVEYADGGHDRVYSFIPKGEIWLEEVLPAHEIKFILLHELHERYLMGQGKDYAHAHKGATQVEDYYRDYPKEINKRIKEEIEKNVK